MIRCVHARTQLGYLYFSPGSGVLPEQGNFYRCRVLLQDMPPELMLKLLRKNGAREDLCRHYRPDRAGGAGD